MTTPTEKTPEVTVVCSGWGIEHGLIVLRKGPDDGRVSHGMCERCRLLMDADGRLDGPRLEEYRVYLQGVLDPRD
jgi:hypothetical protein